MRKDIRSWKRAGWLLVAALTLAALGYFVAESEDRHVGATHRTSLCILALAALFLYFAVLQAAVLLWRRLRGREASSRPLESDDIST